MSVSVVGFDIGTLSSYVVVARQGGIEAVANEYSDRNTPSFISFNDKMRCIGHEAKQQQVTNIPNTLYNFTLFLGKQFNDSAVQREMKRVPYKVICLDDNRVGIEVSYLGESHIFTPEQVLAMHLTKLKEVAEMNLSTKVVDVVINVPNAATDSERRAVLDAAQIANLNCIRLINDTTASAVAYGLYCPDFPEPEQKPRQVAFIDMGYSKLQANIVAFNKGKMRVVASTCADVGGKDFDRVIYEQAKINFKSTFKLDVIDGKKPSIRLTQECEKLKKLMSANSTDIPMNIECFMNDVDVHMRMKRDDFENLSISLLQKVKETLSKMLEEAKISIDDIQSVELIGGSTRIPAVKQIISELFGKDGRTSLNADEAVARGCAIQCAIISPAFKVKDFNITDACSHAINLCYNDGEKMEDLSAYPRWTNFPSSKLLTFFRTNNFQLESRYSDTSSIPNDNVLLGVFSVLGVKPGQNGEPAKIKVKLRVNANGIFTVSQAQLVEMVEKQVEVEVDAEEKKESPEKMEVDSTNIEPNGTAPAEGEQKVENGDATADKKNKKVKKMVTKNVTNHTDLPVEASNLQYSIQKLNEFNEKENQMVMQVKLEKERGASKNAVEEYVYEMRDKLYGSFEQFINESDREIFCALLTKTENWLYDEGEDENKQTYIDRLVGMQKFGDVVVHRAREAYNRQGAIDDFSRVSMNIQKVLAAVENKEDAYDHLDATEVQTLTNVLTEKQTWFTQEVNKQRERKAYEDPILLVSQIVAARQELERLTNPIVNKSRPVVTPPEDKKPTEAGNETAGDEQKNANNNPTSDENQAPTQSTDEAPSSSTKPDDMDLD